MTSSERDDYSADIQFGEWLRSKRVKLALSIEAAAKLSQITSKRLQGLELGQEARGLTRPEAIRLADAYKLDLTEILNQAAGS